MSNNVKFKVVILGTEGVGKTCLLNRIVNDKFTDKYQATVAGVFRAKFFTSCGQTIQVGIWDTVGTERYRSMNQLFYRGAKAAIVCYDICEAKTWSDIKYWISQLRQHEEDCKIYLCGTKKDLVTDGLRQREVDFKVTSMHAEGIQAKIREVSSKTGDNVVMDSEIIDLTQSKETPNKLQKMFSNPLPSLQHKHQQQQLHHHPSSSFVELFQMIVDDYVEAHSKHEQLVMEDSIKLSSKPTFRQYLCCS